MGHSLAENLRLLCSDYRSVSEVCRKLGFNRQQFARYLTGEARPSHHNLYRIASGFGVAVDDLLRPKSEFETSVRPKGLSAQGRVARLIDRAFPGDMQKLRPLLGYYHMHFFVPYSSGSVESFGFFFGGSFFGSSCSTRSSAGGAARRSLLRARNAW